MEFALLPETFPYHDLDMKKHSNTYLTGIHSTILEKYEEEVNPDDPPQGDNQDNNNNENNQGEAGEVKERDPLEDTIELEVKVEIKKKNFTELNKISYIIRMIDHDTNIAPEGAFKILPIHELRRNDTFRGLKEEGLLDLNKYIHFRPITDPKKKEIIESDDAIFRNDILDSIADDPMRGSWIAQLDSSKKIVLCVNIRLILGVYYGLDILLFIKLEQIYILEFILEKELDTLSYPLFYNLNFIYIKWKLID
jgi:hypothetical protein